jgi:deoxyguanosine kinase
MIVVVTGNDGVGKSTFAALLAARLDATVVPEPFHENPFGMDYLRLPEEWAYQAEVEFLRLRVRAIRSALKESDNVICDRHFWDDIEVFSELWRSLGVLEDREVQSLRNLAVDLSSDLMPPRAWIWLRASLPCMVRRIRERGYYPQRLTLEEITALRETYYERWMVGRAHLRAVVDTTERDLTGLAHEAERIATLLQDGS